jgi:hypothetical protein
MVKPLPITASTIILKGDPASKAAIFKDYGQSFPDALKDVSQLSKQLDNLGSDSKPSK